jgi:tetratricopeptide (TPR) repeat protein
MDIKELVNNGWARHADQTEDVARDLEAHHAMATQVLDANALIQLANHAIGEHLGDWARACRLAEKVAAGREDAPEMSGMYSMLATAQYLSGKVPEALISEAHAVRLTKMEQVSVVIAIRARVGSALVFNHRVDEGALVFDAALKLARAHDGKLGCDMVLAAASHNLANELMYRKTRTHAEDALMVKAAEASKEFWLKCGTWENEERGDYMLALVHNKLGDPDTALEHAARGLDVIARNGEEPVDEAFLNLAMADAFRHKQDRGHYQKALERADELAEEFPEAGLKSWFAGERAKVEWKG